MIVILGLSPWRVHAMFTAWSRSLAGVIFIVAKTSSLTPGEHATMFTPF